MRQAVRRKAIEAEREKRVAVSLKRVRNQPCPARTQPGRRQGDQEGQSVQVGESLLISENLMARNTTEGVTSLDIAEMKRRGWLNHWGGPGQLHWSRGGERFASAEFWVHAGNHGPEAVRLRYKVVRADGKTSCDYTVRLAYSWCHFGGWRTWWICPLTVNGRVCGRRCRILYLPYGADYFGCRKCYDLAYESSQRSGNRYYETLSRPLNALERYEDEFERCRSPRRRGRLLRDALWANRVLQAWTF